MRAVFTSVRADMQRAVSCLEGDRAAVYNTHSAHGEKTMITGEKNALFLSGRVD